MFSRHPTQPKPAQISDSMLYVHKNISRLDLHTMSLEEAVMAGFSAKTLIF